MNAGPQRSDGAAAPEPRRGRTARRLALAALGCAVLAGGAALGGRAILERLPLPALAPAEDLSAVVLDRDGRLLRPFPTAEGRWRLPVEVGEIDPRFLTMLMAYEDKRFRAHAGVDPLAGLRAAGQALGSGRIVSGASTLTMQVARLLEPRPAGRTAAAKLREIGHALALERDLGKDEILRLYLTLAPYGGNIEGVRAASLAYFGREPKRLSLAEAALLVALPQSPEARRPDRAPETARAARNRVLDRLAAAGVIRQDEAERAKREPSPTLRQPFPMLAAHASAEALRDAAGRRAVRLSIDRGLQHNLEQLARQRAAAQGERISVAILVVRAATGEVLAHVGAADPLDGSRAGFVDMTAAVRSPGSALKPFIYGLAFEDGILHPETLIEDRPTRFGSYAPTNFDETFQGTVPARKALAMSLNIPAVAVLAAIGPERLAARLKHAGARLVLPGDEAPGLPIALGGVGVTLRDLAGLYAGLANRGRVAPLTWRPAGAEGADGLQRRLLDPVAAWYVGQSLAGAPPPEAALAGRLAFKTGTSYGYRDAWSIGYDGEHVVAVWVGRPDGAASPGLSGRGSAAPILFDAFTRLGSRTPLPAAPPGALMATNAKLPPPLRLFGEAGRASAGGAGPALTIAYPPDGARIDLADGSPDRAPLALKAAGGVLPLTWFINGRPVSGPPHRREASWNPNGPGFARVSVIDARGQSASAVVRID